MSPLQEQILRGIPKGKQSKSSLMKSLNKHYADINGAVKILQDENLIKQEGQRQGRGREEKFYILTESGINKLIEMHIPLESFWRMLFFIFDKNTQHDLTKISIEQIISKYEQNVLLFSREYVTPFYDWTNNKLVPLEKNSEYKFIIEVLWTLLEKGKIEEDDILILINKFKENTRSTKGSLDILKIMKECLLIYPVGFNLDKLSLSHFGLLLLLDDLYKNEISNNNRSVSDWTMLRLRIRDSNFLPLVLRNWQKINKIFSKMELLEIFHIVLNWQYSEISKIPLQNNGLFEIFNILRSMNINFQKLLEIEYEIALEIQEEWFSNNKNADNKSFLFSFNDAINKKLKFPKTTGGLSCKIAMMEHENLVYDRTKSDLVLRDLYRINTVKKGVDRFIAFLFYIVLIHLIKQKLFSPSIDPKQREMIENVLKELLDQEKELGKWYSKWIQEIINFESRNLELIKKINVSLTENNN